MCVDNQPKSNTGLYNLPHFTLESFREKKIVLRRILECNNITFYVSRERVSYNVQR